MKIVGFEADGRLQLGVVEGDTVVDLQAVDGMLPGDLGEVLRRTKGELQPLADLAKIAKAEARRPLEGLKYALPVARPGKIVCLGLNYLDHVKEGPQRDNVPKFPSIFFRVLTSMVPHLQPIMRPREVDPARLRSRAGGDRRQARQAPDARQRARLHRRLCLRQRGLGARIPAPHHAMGHGQEFRPHRRLRALDGVRRRSAARRQGPQDHEPAQRQHHAVRQHGEHDVPAGRAARSISPRA